MYTMQVPYKDLDDKPRGKCTLHFNLFVPDVIKMAGTFQTLFRFMNDNSDERLLSMDEKLDFYNALETVILEAWGEPSEDRLRFSKSGRYDFAESVMFAAAMTAMASDPAQAIKLIEGIMPKDLAEIIKNTEVNLQNLEGNPETPEALKAEIAKLRAQIPASEVSEGAPAS